LAPPISFGGAPFYIGQEGFRALVGQEASTKVAMREGIGISNELLGGATPMLRCLKSIHERFLRERSNSPPECEFVLFVISDGESSDGDPRPAAQAIKDSGIKIISCSLTSTNATAPKMLYSGKKRRWSKGAKVMYDVASWTAEDGPEFTYLSTMGWTVVGSSFWRKVIPRQWQRIGRYNRRRLKLFTQINHSAHLEDFSKVVLVV